MPYIQPKKNNYFGFTPAKEEDLLVANPYLVSSSEGAIYAGDVVTLSTIGTVKAAAQSATAAILGVAAQTIAANAGSTAATYASPTQMLLVHDDPEMIFAGTASTSYIINSTSIGKTVTFLATGVVGSTGVNTNLNRSVMAISGETASSAGGPFKLLGLHPVEGNDFSTDAGSAGVAASARKWLVKPDIHLLGLRVGVAPITS
jgi:hypothetical protein